MNILVPYDFESKVGITLRGCVHYECAKLS